ncbi:unnamed protein product [Prorocentrum cordatum]|uniref:Nucleoporin NSP1-like C-terminal domain-containing protein n=1 Tax=Prorocentrum cordatum TaxID=2364126 RepID=A0ABN9YAB7_9DINO|nr:unnamed protein product [Polarella glacialis]
MAEVSASPRNVLASFENAGEGKAVAVTCKEMVDAMSSAPGYDTLEKWMQRKVKDSLAEPAHGSVTSPAITAAMRHHCGLLRPDGPLFRQLFLPETPKEQGLQKSVYGVQLFVALAVHIACSPAPFGVSECRVVIEGSELIIAVRASATVGLGGNFAVELKSNMMAMLPAGYQFLIYHKDVSRGYRWGLSPEGDTQRTQVMVASVLEAHDALKVARELGHMFATFCPRDFRVWFSLRLHRGIGDVLGIAIDADDVAWMPNGEQFVATTGMVCRKMLEVLEWLYRNGLMWFCLENVAGIAYKRKDFRVSRHKVDSTESGLPAKRQRIYIIGMSKHLLLGAGCGFPAPLPPMAPVKLSEFLDAEGPSESPLPAAPGARLNVEVYNKLYLDMQKARGEAAGAVAVCDLTRDPTKVFGRFLYPESCGALTTKNTYLWVVGRLDGKVEGHGRWLRLSERCRIMGLAPESLVGVITDKALMKAVGNTMAVGTVGRALTPIMRVCKRCEVNQGGLPVMLPQGFQVSEGPSTRFDVSDVQPTAKRARTSTDCRDHCVCGRKAERAEMIRSAGLKCTETSGKATCEGDEGQKLSLIISWAAARSASDGSVSWTSWLSWAPTSTQRALAPSMLNATGAPSMLRAAIMPPMLPQSLLRLHAADAPSMLQATSVPPMVSPSLSMLQAADVPSVLMATIVPLILAPLSSSALQAVDAPSALAAAIAPLPLVSLSPRALQGMGLPSTLLSPSPSTPTAAVARGSAVAGGGITCESSASADGAITRRFSANAGAASSGGGGGALFGAGTGAASSGAGGLFGAGASGAASSGAGGLFGAGASGAASGDVGGLFGAGAASAGAAGLFGAGASGAASGAGGLFGAASGAGAVFGAGTSGAASGAGALFGAGTGAASGAGGLFGAASGAGAVFGAGTSGAASGAGALFGAASGAGGLFGAGASGAASGAGALFGAGTGGAAASGGLFGASGGASAGAGGLFGASTSGSAGALFGASAGAAAAGASAGAGTLQQAKAAVVEHRKVSDLMRTWEERVHKQAQHFESFAAQVMQNDTEIIAYAAKVKGLASEHEKLKNRQERVDTSIQQIWEQQDALGRLLASLEDTLQTRLPGPAAGALVPEGAHRRAQVLTAQLDELDRQAEELARETETARSTLYAEPLTSVVRVLDAHASALDSIQAQASSLEQSIRKAEASL